MKKHFTLTEILVVVFLIGLLSAIGFGMYGYAMSSAREKSTRALFARIEAAIESCNTKFGYIPVSDSEAGEFTTIKITVGNDGLVDEIDFGGKTFSKSGSQAEKDYLKEFLLIIDAESLKNSRNSDEQLEDAWGSPIYYAYPGKFNKTSFDLYSAGADGRLGKDNKILSATELKESTLELSEFKDSNGTMLCDDVINF